MHVCSIYFANFLTGEATETAKDAAAKERQKIVPPLAIILYVVDMNSSKAGGIDIQVLVRNLWSQ